MTFQAETTSDAEGSTTADSAGSVGRSAGRGLRWALLGAVLLKMGSFALSLAMVRLLAPHDFGLYAVALAANAFLIHVNDMGIIAGVVQWRGEPARMLPTARTMAIVFSLSWYALFWFGAPVVAGIAGSPEAIPLMRLLALIIVVDGVTAVSVGLIQRRFQQDKLTKAIAVGFSFSACITLTLAANGAGAYSFVLGSLAQSLVVAALVLRIARVPFRLGLDRQVARRLIVFGAPLALGLGIESVLLYSDSMIVGNVLGTYTLGFYLLAFNIASWVPGLVSTAVRYVSIPAFSRLAEHEMDTVAGGAQRTIPLLIGFVMPIAAGMVALAPSMIHVLYGERWLPSAEALRFLAFVMVARMLTALVFDIQTGLGNTPATTVLNLVWLVVLVPALWVGANLWGMRGAAMSNAVVALLVAIPLAFAMLHRAGVDMRPVLRRSVRPVLSGIAAGLTMALVASRLDLPAADLLVAGSLGVLVYLGLAVPAGARAVARDWVAVRLANRRQVKA
ncbi:oligosaccharide flippase family protein [Nocardioides sp. YIM 152588]|uniref:oligosaccharide flippase family protein n=1 Tax=Nocardioides sp. YIM 152588 TaxID=3158259 RepID=UPI0032E510EF